MKFIMNQSELTPAAVRHEVAGWINYLNEIVGVLCFTLALSVVSTQNPVFYGALAFIFVAFFHIPNFKRKAGILSYLRGKNDRSDFEEQVLKDLLAQIKFSKLGMLMIGYTLLFFVTAGPILFEDCPLVIKFIYGE